MKKNNSCRKWYANHQLAEAKFFLNGKKDVIILYTENFVLIDKQGHIRGLYNGTLAVEVGRIMEDVDALTK